MEGNGNKDVNINLNSQNNNDSWKIKTQKDMVVEFMKVLSLAH